MGTIGAVQHEHGARRVHIFYKADILEIGLARASYDSAGIGHSPAPRQHIHLIRVDRVRGFPGNAGDVQKHVQRSVSGQRDQNCGETESAK
jgi:hypothetical protein